MGTTEAAAAGEGADALRASLLPPPPPTPPDLTRATARYKRHAWLAVLGLLAFVGLYVSLTGWFCFTSVQLFIDMASGGQDGFLDFVGGALSGLLGAFLLGALFFIKAGGKVGDLEVTAAEEPALFAFLNALADRAGAARPHRVFLSMRVNAAVFYDLSLVNLLFPSKKNLEIGLGLVNTLNLSEMTAVLAHEYGHFAQRSMAVGRWVYMAQQVAGQIVVSRSWLDRALAALSSIDIRVAWIGWLMRIIVWSIRSLLDTTFGLVILAQRALGREMEFQADLVSVSLTGSDALVHALHRLGAADGAWSNALGVAGNEAGRGHAVPDLFAMQTRIIARMGDILNEPTHGASPVLPVEARHEYRVFQHELAEPPRMWSTHPGNRDREDNAKRVYVPAELDARSAFCLFADPEGLRRRATARLLAEISEKKLEPIDLSEALAAVDKRFDRPHLAQRYRGVYLGRSIVLHEKSPKKLYQELTPVTGLRETLSRLYPEELASDVRDLRLRQEERAHLEALRDGLLDAPGGVIRHRGQVIQRRALVSVLAQVTGETETVRGRVEAHDKLCRSSHLAAARELGKGWGDYLSGLINLHHYAAHVEANLEDARGHLNNVFAVVTADGRVTASERRRLVMASAEVHAALWEIFEQRMQVELPEEVMKRLVEALGVEGDEDEPKHWADALPKNFSLPPPSDSNIAEFLRVLDSWVRGALGAVGTLERVSLELLVETEAYVAEHYLAQTEPRVAPAAPITPGRYQTLARGQERDRQKRLGWWDRFQTANGFFPSLLRFVVAGAILAGVLGFGGAIGHPTLTAINGLALPVVVEAGGTRLSLAPGEHGSISPAKGRHVRLVARSESGDEIEAQTVSIEGSEHYIYNVAGATALVEWTAVYGSASAVPERKLGAPTWFATRARTLFEKPPTTLSSQSGAGTRTVLSGFAEEPPFRVLGLIDSEAERAQLVAAHAAWDPPESVHVSEWLRAAASTPEGGAIMQRRLQRYPDDMATLRQEQDLAKGEAKVELCERTRRKAALSPESLDLQYLVLRCADDAPSNQAKFIEQYEKHPQHPYFAWAAGWELWRRRDYEGAIAAYQVAAGQASLKEGANLELARLFRLTGKATRTRLAALASDSSSLSALLALDTGDGTADEERAFSILGSGQLEQAVEVARPSARIYDHVLRLAAASEGASRALVDAALALEGEPASVSSIWPSIALLEREGRPHAALDARAQKELSHGADETLSFANGDYLKSKPEVLEAALEQLLPEQQAFACVMALVRDAERAPSRCRELAKASLFASERPFFR